MSINNYIRPHFSWFWFLFVYVGCGADSWDSHDRNAVKTNLCHVFVISASDKSGNLYRSCCQKTTTSNYTSHWCVSAHSQLTVGHGFWQIFYHKTTTPWGWYASNNARMGGTKGIFFCMPISPHQKQYDQHLYINNQIPPCQAMRSATKTVKPSTLFKTTAWCILGTRSTLQFTHPSPLSVSRDREWCHACSGHHPCWKPGIE